MNRHLSSSAALSALLTVCLVAAGVEWRALNRLDHPAPRLIDAQYCAKCHSSPAGLAMMKRKEGGVHFLFHGSDGPPSAYPHRTVSKIPVR